MTDRAPDVAAVAWIFLALTWVAVSLRCYVRVVMTKSFGTDDWLAVGSLILFTVYGVFVLLGVKYGTGRHITELPPENIILSFKYWWVAEIMYVACTAVCKASIGVFLLRICGQRSQIYVIWTVMAMVTLYSTFYIFLIVFQCKPISFFWMRFAGVDGKCISTQLVSNSTYTHSAISAVSDWTLGILPIFIVWNLKMTPRTKVSVAMILALGTIGSTATVVRIPYIYQVTNTLDFLFATVDVAIWSTVEPGIGITCAALACCRPLFLTFFSRTRLWGGSSTEHRGTSGWPANGPSRAGYMRSGSHHIGGAAFRMEPSTTEAKNTGITTIVRSQMGDREDDTHHDINHDVELGEVARTHGGLNRTASESSLKGDMGWTMGDSKLADDSSEDYILTPQKLKIGVRTTTKIVSGPASDGEGSSRDGRRGERNHRGSWIKR